MKSPFSRSSTPSSSPMRYTPPSSPIHCTLSDSLVEENVEMAEAIIAKWDPTNCSGVSKISMLFRDNRYEAKQFLSSIKNLQAAMHYYIKGDHHSDKLKRAQRLMQTAMKRLERELRDILSTNKEYLDPESISNQSPMTSMMASPNVQGNNYDNESDQEEEFRFLTGPESSPSMQSEEDRTSSIAMTDLKAIADCMTAAGYGMECVKIYKIVRKSIVDEALYRHGVVRSMSTSEIQKMEWEALEGKIRSWLRAVKFSVRTIFYGERILCDHVFSSSPLIRQSCFNEITQEAALALFGFPERVAKCKKLSAEKMFQTLDMYEAIANLWPEIESIVFSDESASAVRSQAVNSLNKLGDAARSMLANFESAIEKDSSKFLVPGGGLHPLTRYVMNYITFLADYTEILSDIIPEWPVKAQPHLPELYFSVNHESYSSVISARIAWIVLLMMCKLDRKAELYKDPALSYFFLANNLQYVVSKVQQSNLKDLLGNDWIAQHESKVKQYVASYERIGWRMVIESLPPPPAAAAPCSTSADSKGDLHLNGAVREGFRRFNFEFELAYQKQLKWVVPDQKMRNSIKVSLSGKLMPAYTALYEAHGACRMRDANSSRESVVKFSPEVLGKYLSELFLDSGGSIGSTTSSNSHSSSMSGAASPESGFGRSGGQD
ncbi:hypothetical protein SAY86_014445 [Trapa natans]|uniref:Exocyst subunit Exo70 family protein n=1 Tax=Trapa natans TaxID=22666 RepID=A0AAN7QRD8_TRANT|nr:hypothetical protein SAY86_014445 [Trapa natans]